MRAIWVGAAALAAIWLLAWAGYSFASSRKITAEKVQSYMTSVDLGKLQGAERAAAIQRLADELNALSLEERRRVRMEGQWNAWFQQMTEEERAGFIEATLPTGFKQMIAAFEELPEEKRQRAVNEALRRLREAGQGVRGANRDPNAPALSEETQRQVTTIGLKAFYSQSTAQTKAELAPFLEELQRQMQSGRLMIGRHGR